jgi:hypothetical protein
MPLRRVNAFELIGTSCHDKKKIRQAIQIPDCLCIDRLLDRGRYHAPLSPPADGPCNVKSRCRFTSAWKNEAPELRKALRDVVDQLLESLRHCLRYARYARFRISRRSEVCTYDEQIVLDLEERLIEPMISFVPG